MNFKTKHLSSIYTALCDLIHPICYRIANKMANVEIIPYKAELIPNDKPLIFVANHSNVHDVPVMLSIINKHVYVLAGDEVKDDINGLAFRFNGVVWVHRGDKESARIAKEKVLNLLHRKKNILIFPEATWNLTPNLPMLPLHWGAVEFAQETNTSIVPITLEYTKDNKCYYSIGKELHTLKTDNKAEITNTLRDTLATMRWNFWEEHSNKSYNEISNEDFLEYTKYRLDEYPKLDIEFERTTILKKYNYWDEVFEHLDLLAPTTQTAFLFNRRLK